MRNAIRLAAVGALLLMSAGCSTTIRRIAVTYYTSPAVDPGSTLGAYVGYWEGDCKPFLGCGIGDSKIQWCALDEGTNALNCSEQTNAGEVLSRKTKKKG